jgi:hypothetical protein
MCLSGAFFPESLEELTVYGRSSDLSRFLKPSHPFLSGQWQVIRNTDRLWRTGITAAGTVTDSNRIPFSLQHLAATPKQYKYMLFANKGR